MLHCKLNKRPLLRDLLLKARLGLSFLNNDIFNICSQVSPFYVNGESQENFCSDTESCF